jgi:hypothetical protein
VRPQVPSAQGTTDLPHRDLGPIAAGTWSIPAGAPDRQSRHAQDEIYVVVSGRGAFTAHRFHDVTEDLATLVFFAPAFTP